MSKNKRFKEGFNRHISPLCYEPEDYTLDLESPLSYNDQKPSCSKTDYGDSLEVSVKGKKSVTSSKIDGYTRPVRSSCARDLRPIPSSSDILNFGTHMESLQVGNGEWLARGTKRKREENEHTGPHRKRQKTFHVKKPFPERGTKRKHWSDHSENVLKRQKTWHRTDPASFIMPCQKTCACYVGQVRIIPIKRRSQTESSLLRSVLKENLYISASTHQMPCCKKRCYSD